MYLLTFVFISMIASTWYSIKLVMSKLSATQKDVTLILVLNVITFSIQAINVSQLSLLFVCGYGVPFFFHIALTPLQPFFDAIKVMPFNQLICIMFSPVCIREHSIYHGVCISALWNMHKRNQREYGSYNPYINNIQVILGLPSFRNEQTSFSFRLLNALFDKQVVDKGTCHHCTSHSSFCVKDY